MFTYSDCLSNGVDVINGNGYVDTDPVQAHQVTIATADDSRVRLRNRSTCFELQIVCVCSCDRLRYQFSPPVVASVRADLDVTALSPSANGHISSFAVDNDKRKCGKMRQVWD